MAVKPNAIDQIKQSIESCVGKKVHLRANRGRRKVIEAEGVLEETYPNLFVIRLDEGSAVQRMSYTYADVLTETVQLTVEGDRVGAIGA